MKGFGDVETFIFLFGQREFLYTMTLPLTKHE